MIAWVGIVSICLASFVLFVFYKAMSSLSYEQSRWVQLYKQEERSSMSRKLRQRASDLAQEITKQFLLEERSRVQSLTDTLFIRYINYTVNRSVIETLVESVKDPKAIGNRFLEFILQKLVTNQMDLLFCIRHFMSGPINKLKAKILIQLLTSSTLTK